jgi:hypothetical protein
MKSSGTSAISWTKLTAKRKQGVRLTGSDKCSACILAIM